MYIIEKIDEYPPPTLARIADCTTPDSNTGDGADFLAKVRDSVIDLIAHHMTVTESSIAEVINDFRDKIQDVASVAAISPYAPEKWRQFVDLSAYTEDISQFGTPTNDTLDGRADLMLGAIGHRLASGLLDEIKEGLK
ncbi:hypothetical protein ACFYXW_27515 [Streptomyces sp. NPDC001981]|uniref:hypothetical protein n=1 Tax=Streptomyces sp. NPDC001981 TaxID=3364628 RepID=UPI0036C7FA6A